MSSSQIPSSSPQRIPPQQLSKKEGETNNPQSLWSRFTSWSTETAARTNEK